MGGVEVSLPSEVLRSRTFLYEYFAVTGSLHIYRLLIRIVGGLKADGSEFVNNRIPICV